MTTEASTGQTNPPKLSSSAATLVKKLRKDLADRKGLSFEALLKKWEKTYGSRAAEAALPIARDLTLPDADRYIALMAVARLGGKAMAGEILVFLTDSSWMMRVGALRLLSGMGHALAGTKILAALEDPALVVRSEAVEAIARLKPEGAAGALVQAANDQKNYHGGKAQGVPQRALAALHRVGATSDVAQKLRPLLDKDTDPDLQRETVRTLEALTGQILKKGAPLKEQVSQWKTILRR